MTLQASNTALQSSLIIFTNNK